MIVANGRLTGTSAEYALKTAKYASARYLDTLPTHGSETAHGFRDLEMEEKVLDMTRHMDIGAQFGGKYFCHDVRVIRLPRHGASLPVAIAVSCSADRQAKAKITPEGIFLEKLETNPGQCLPELTDADIDHKGGDDTAVKIDLSKPMDEILATLSKYPIKQKNVRTYQKFLWRDMPQAKQPKNADGSLFYTNKTMRQFRLSSKSHWDVPIELDKGTIHFLVAHPTPPVFDGNEDRNGCRNHDEIRLLADYVDPRRSRYLVDDQGISTCLDAQTGKRSWQKRLTGAYTASPIATDQFIYFTNEDGLTIVLAAHQDRYVEKARNRIDEAVYASSAIDAGQLFIRSSRHLWCIAH